MAVTNNLELSGRYRNKNLFNKSIKLSEFKIYSQNANIKNIDFPFEKKTCTALRNNVVAFLGHKYEFSSEELVDIFAPVVGTKNIPLLKHSYATSSYAEALAKAIKLSAGQVQDIKIATFLHDIGKLISPENAFSHSGLMANKYKYHPAVGEIWLSQINNLKNRGISSFVGLHHTYNPNTTNIMDKIIPVVDSFDSITVPKYPDRLGKHYSQAVEELKSKKGISLDPIIVDKFIEIISENDFALFKTVQSQTYRKTEDFKLDFCLGETIEPATNIRNLLNPLLSGEIYRKKIAKEIGCNTNDLQAVIGPNELREEIKKLKPENFDPSNATTGIFSVNLHLHTTASDGSFTPETFFEEVDKQVNKIKESGQKKDFIVAVTDHDTVDGIKDFLKYIAKETQKNHDRFKNIKFVPGIEINSIYKNPKYLKQPVQLEILGYCINPFDKKLEEMLKKIKDGNRSLINEIIIDANKKYGIDITDFEEMNKHHNALRIAGGSGISDELNQYLQRKGLEEHQIRTLFKDKIPVNGCTTYTPDIETVLKITKGTMAGIAHPSRIKIADKVIKNKAASKDLKDEEIAMFRLFKDFASLGGYAAEANYQHDTRFIRNDESFTRIVNLVSIFCEKVDLLKSGGV
ncbi:MAG: HD domain-containing phosphohydrolase, partial [Candidatus Gastranaerophilaceae bacterium]